MNEARAAAISENQSQAQPDESASSVQNVPEVSETELSDIHSILTTMDFTSSLLSSETKQSAGCDVAPPKASAVQSMVGVMTKFTDHVETEFLSKILDATSSLKDCQDFTDSLKAVIAYLLDQNRLLLKCLGDIGTEAEKRADLLQQRLRETAVTTRGARCVVEALSEENSRLKSRNENLDHDLHSLLSIVKVARTTGNWEGACAMNGSTLESNDGHPTKTSSHEDTAADGGPQPDHATYSGMAHHSLSGMDNSTQTEDSRKTSGVTSTQTDAELEAQSKTLLAMQLQTHLDSSSKQVELMEQALQNLEKKLSASRQECDDLKKEVTCVQVKLEHAEAATKKEQEVNTQLRTEVIALLSF
ncbi:hypothetical protein HPB48_015489 [Haemaphysalis longicornis]|uniref:Uncharacterized protein n=1 Tax=Haemaphysalis longicornis TaxID=44386 RepID=A0A9J6FHU9_HAELO|nr:hypothetical protein HPB48_015489 [Haemaphysalis longicornis]